MSKQSLYQRVDEAIERGETWRAKEMLRGNVGSGSYDSQLYERYGKLLLDLAELVEAGKYLFLSGRRHPEYDEAIEVYLSRHPESRLLFYSFPSGARFRELHRYPLEVRRVLEERGLPQYFADVERELVERWRRRKRERTQDTDDDATLGLLRHEIGSGGWFGYAPLRHRLAFTPAQVGLRALLQAFLGAVILFLGASMVVGLAVIVRWLVSLT